MWRRLVPVPFDWQCPEGRQNRATVKPEFWVTEASGILKCMLTGLNRLRRQGKFPDCEAVRRAIAEHRDESNPTAAFLRDHNHVEPEGFVSTAEILEGCKKWHEREGHSLKVTCLRGQP